MLTGTNQAGAAAHGGDVVGRDKRTTINNFDLRRTGAAGKIEALKARLLLEMEADTCVPELVERLQHYHRRRPAADGVEGLEGKLRAAGREHELLDALEQKEMFAKLLAKYALYESAQDIFVHLLSMAVHEFRMCIQPHLGALDAASYNEIVTQKIVLPLVQEAGDGVLSMDALVTMGMYYWLSAVRAHETDGAR